MRAFCRPCEYDMLPGTAAGFIEGGLLGRGGKNMSKFISNIGVVAGLAVVAAALGGIGFVAWQVFSGAPLTDAQGKPVGIPPMSASAMVGFGAGVSLPALWISAVMVRRLSRIRNRQTTLLKIAQPLFMVAMAAFIGLILTFCFFGEQKMRQMAKDSRYMVCKIEGGGYFGLSKMTLVKSAQECTAAGGAANPG